VKSYVLRFSDKGNGHNKIMIGAKWRFSDEMEHVGYPTWNIPHLVFVG
jgi:hypothetical protein